jgi:hypothetical protein
MASYAEPSDLAAIWRPLTADETEIAFNRLEQASRKIRREIGPVGGLSIDQRIAAGLLDIDDVKDVAVEMVRRVMSIPGYIRQQSVTVDDATKSLTFDGSVSGGVMFIDDEERRSLMGRPTMGAFTITPGGQSDDVGFSYSENARLWPATWAPIGTPWT